MNKLFAIAFTCIYLLLTVGVVKTTHYCMGREKSTKLFTFESKKCVCAQISDEMEGCCHDQHEILKVDDSQTVTSLLSVVSPVYQLVGSVDFSVVESKIIVKAIIDFDALDERPPSGPPIYISQQSLVLYEG